MNWKKQLPVILALTFAGLASLTAYQFLNGRSNVSAAPTEPMTPVVVLKHDVAVGMKITQEDLDVEYWPKENVTNQFFTSTRPLVGRILRVSMIAKEPVTQAKLMGEEENVSMLIPAQMRGVTITVPRSKAMSQMLERGSMVDVLVMFDDGSGPPHTKVVAQAARVLSVYDRNDPLVPDHSTKFMEVTLLVSPREAEWLLIAANKGTMQIVLRNDRSRTV